MMESRRVSPRSCIKFVPGMRDLAEEFQSRRVGGTKGSECGCNKLVSSSFYVGSMLVNFHAFTGSNLFWV